MSMSWLVLHSWKSMTLPFALILGANTIFTHGSVNPPLTENAVHCAPSTPTKIQAGDFIKILLPEGASPNAQQASVSDIWLRPCVISHIAGRVCIPNLSENPHVLKKIEHFCQINFVLSPAIHDLPSNPLDSLPLHKLCPVLNSEIKHSLGMALDPNGLLPPDARNKFHSFLDQFNSVFDQTITGYKALSKQR